MKKILYIIVSMVFAIGFWSCSLDVENKDDQNTADAFKTLKDVRNGMNGAYNALGGYYFLGNYAVAIGDMCAGVSAGNSSTGHFYAFSNFSFSDTEGELENVWGAGFQIIDRTTRAIKGGKALLANGTIASDGDKATLNSYLGQCYALKALANYYLVNLFALPYSDANKSSLGLPIVKDEPVEVLKNVQRSTVEETYAQIVSDLTASETAFTAAGDAAESSAYYLGVMGLKALQARVYMSLGKYAEAEAAAKAAIELKGKGDGTATDVDPSNESYVNMWTSTAATSEDIFTIIKSDNDNLSANALNTLYGSYKCTIQKTVLKLFAATPKDIRMGLLSGNHPKKFDGTSTAQAVSNIPVFRKSEMSLIIAECEARIGSIEQAQNYLLYTAKRNLDITKTSDLPSTTADLLTFISNERIREFYAEGHRFYDARRMGDIVKADMFSSWDVQKFVFPIPAAEINSGFGVTQNTNWSDNLPTK